nr:aminoglycoside phosphotransferase family protein [Kibdelosporangium sp. MJ126-NF4]CEL21936.1 hypothetical protein [Kibdelosporangium sp. MJ126-NF4]CTQ92716.1 hypothetical protein [Kibdelosporangium sp. MJ126-NF4]
MGLTWLGEPSVDALRAALRTVAPELSECAIVLPQGLDGIDDPQWCAATAMAGDRYVVKFAWSKPSALRICHMTRVLGALPTAAPELPLPEIVIAAQDPAVVVLRRVPGATFFGVRNLIGPGERERVARDLAAALAQLHDPGVLRTVAAAVGPLPQPQAQATTDMLRSRFAALIRPDQRARMRSWCDRADHALARTGRTVLIHGDFHGNNHLWDPSTLRLRLVIDLETVGAGEPEFDLRYLPAEGGVELFTATVAHYETLTGTTLDTDRIMAWHLRTMLGDALWRAEADLPLPDRRTPIQWLDDLTARFAALDAPGWTV